MTWRDVKHVIIEADTRTLEFFQSVITGTWGMWLLTIPHNDGTELVVEALKAGGGPAVLGLAAIGLGLFQGTAVWYRYPRLRRWSSSFSAVFWILCGFIMGEAQPGLFTATLAAVMALGELWIVLHRSTVEVA